MNKFLQTTLITAVLSTGAMAETFVANQTDMIIEGELNIYGRFVNDKTLDFTPGGHGYIADGVLFENKGPIKLGKPEGATDDELATVNVTREITTELAEEGGEPTTTTYYQYRYISTDGAVKYVWSQNKNATSSDTDFVADMTDPLTTVPLSDYSSGFGLVKGIVGGTITGGVITQISDYDNNHIDINTDAKYEVMAGYALNKDERTLTFNEETDPEKVFIEKYSNEQKKILEKDSSGGLFTPDITNPEVISTITNGAQNLGEKSKNGLDPQKLSSQTEVKEYLSEWRVTMHKGEQDIAYEETESNTIIEQLAKSTPEQAVAIPDELGKGNGEITVTMPKWKQGDPAPDYISDNSVTIPGNLHNIGYENEILNFTLPDWESEYTRSNNLKFEGNNQYLKGTVNFGGEDSSFEKIIFEEEDSIPGGITNCYSIHIIGGMQIPDTYDEYTGKTIVQEGSTFNVLDYKGNGTCLQGNFVVKGVMNIGAPAATE